jgi:hypothetical protein
MIALLLAGLFGHRRPDDPIYVAWAHAVAGWTAAHWQVLAVVIPVAGGIAAGIINHALSVSRENRSRRLTQTDVRTRVHADLAARLLAHCSFLQRAAAASQLDAAAWRSSNASLRARAEMPDLIDVLGPRYVTFMATIEHERRIVEQCNGAAPSSEKTREVLRLYAPFIAEFGEPVQAGRLERA